MQIRQATQQDEAEVLQCLDAFRTACKQIISPDSDVTPSTIAQEMGGRVFQDVVNSENTSIIVAEEQNEIIGIVIAHYIPQVRRGGYFVSIESMFVVEEYQGTDIAISLIKEIESWAKQKNATMIRLESANELKRAHAFYKKVGYQEYGKAFLKKL